MEATKQKPRSVSTRHIYLSLGSNLGAKKENLKKALRSLEEAGIRIAETSPIYETEPVEETDQPFFLNLVCRVVTPLTPMELLETALEIERKMGRERERAKGPRVIDIDLLLHNGLVIDSARLKLPHPGLYRRRFVLVPLADIAPEFREPLSGRTISELLLFCPDKSSVRLLEWRDQPQDGSLAKTD